jgi:hypothetical protein
VCTHEKEVAPVDEQASFVHARPSEQLGAAPAVQVPEEHESETVQPLLSALHDVPFALLDHVVTLVVALVHCWHWFPGFVAPFA